MNIFKFLFYWELYNLDADIGETKNLAAENPELIAELKRQMEEITNRK